MAAFAGIFSPVDPSGASTLLQRMLSAMKGNGQQLPLPANINGVAGTVDPKSAGTCKQSIWSADRTRFLLFNGEEHTYGRTQAIANALKKPSDLVNLNGWFSGLLIDLRTDSITLFNDRFGMGKVYYHQSPQGFFFANEAKAILAASPLTRDLNQQSLAEYLSCGCVLQNRSLFRDVLVLPPGSAWTFHRDGKIEKRAYFDPSIWEQQERLSAGAYSDQLREVFSRLIPRYSDGRQQTALSLTGGLDSRMVLAWVKAMPGALPCYTFGGPFRECADVKIARQLAKIAQQNHSVFTIDKDFFENFAELATETIQVSDGTMDVSGAVELYMNRKAAAIAPVRVTGNYGSEILRANVAFRPRKLDRTLYTPEFNELIDAAEESYRTESRGNQLTFIAFKQVPWHHYSRYSVEKAVLTPRSPFLDNELVALAYRAPNGLEQSADPLLRLIADGNPQLGALPSDRALHFRKSSPIASLKRHWQEFTAKAEYAYDYGMPQWLARTDRIVSELHLERLFLGRHKFYHFRSWYRHPLARFLQELDVSTSSAMGCYKDGLPAHIVREHTTGRGNFTLDIHRAASLSLIQRSLLAA